jgi:phosphate transport system ATP-binding protein
MAGYDTHIVFDRVSVDYAGKAALVDVSVEIPRHRILAIIGPAGSGKTTLLKCINRTLDFVPGVRVRGSVTIDGDDVFRARDVRALRRRVGMVFPLPVGLPLSVYDNVAYAPRLGGVRSRAELDALVEHCLKQAALWDEVKDRLQLLGTRLSGGQQQRLTIARALSHQPDILCLNRFSIAIDPVTTMKIEDVLLELKSRITIVVVASQVQQARRLADRLLFLNAGRVVEAGDTDTMFSEHPQSRLTYEYVRGHFG